MGKLTAYIIGAALVSLSFMTTPAYADCAADLKKAWERLDENMGQKGRLRIKMDLEKAEEKLAKGKKKGCANQVKKAIKKMDTKGWH